MITIIELFKKITANSSKKILGRWNLDYCQKKINKKIDFSNEDHCGPCGNNIIKKIKESVEIKKSEEIKK
jgi:hypothetical protein